MRRFNGPVSRFARAQRSIARQTLAMPDALAAVMGGPSKEEAEVILARGYTGFDGIVLDAPLPPPVAVIIVP